MTFGNSGIYYLNVRDALQNDVAIDWIADTVKVALFTNSITTPNFDTNTAYTSAPYTSNEVGSPSGGIQIANDAFSVSSGTLVYDGDDTAWGSQTLTAARGGLAYDSTTSSVCLFGVTFGADYSTTSGVLTIQWNASGIVNIDLTP